MNKIANKLYIKVSLIFLLFLIVLGLSYVLISTYSAQEYFQERNQKLHENLAEQIMKEVEPFMYNGEMIPERIDEIMHHMMAINPSIEVYILDVNGKILSYVAPYKKVKLDYVNIAPIKKFIENECQQIIKGDDPRNPGKKKVFSAAAHKNMDGVVDGYVYTILASEEYESAASVLFKSYILKVGLRTFALTLIGALVIGLLIIWLLTRNLNKIIATVRRFSGGDYEARIDMKQGGDLSVLAETYNQMAETIQSNIEELKSTETLRRELVANISHDLRTPLAVIHGYLETLSMKEEDRSLNPEDRKKYIEIVLSNTQRLNKLVSELFELSKLEAKQIIPKKEPFFIQELAMDTYNKYKILAEKKKVAIKTEIEEGVPMVIADISMIERVLQNLLDNALKFTEEGDEIKIAINETKQGVSVQVQDSGIGIEKEKVGEMFDRYKKYQSTTHNKEGMGLGLAIVKKILELHNSDINLQSQLDVGSIFKFELELAR